MLHKIAETGKTDDNLISVTRIVFSTKKQMSPPFGCQKHEALNTISNGNSSHFMQTISSNLVKISVNGVNNCTIITWYKIVIDNCFCDGQSS